MRSGSSWFRCCLPSSLCVGLRSEPADANRTTRWIGRQPTGRVSTTRLTIIAGAIGEWDYYIFGSAIEVVLLSAIVYYAWTWPQQTPAVITNEQATTHPESTA
jgi:hypothetical protein